MASGQVINGSWLTLYYPPYWHYDTLHALLILSRMGKAGDPRASDALDEMEQRRRPDGRWRVLVAATGKLRCTRSRRLGPVGPERDDHSQRPYGYCGPLAALASALRFLPRRSLTRLPLPLVSPGPGGPRRAASAHRNPLPSKMGTCSRTITRV